MKPAVFALCAALSATVATAQEDSPRSRRPLSPVSADAPVRPVRLEVEAHQLREDLENWRGRLLGERQPSVAAPVVLAAFSLGMLATSGLLLGALEPWRPGKSFLLWMPVLAALALHVVFAVPAIVLFEQKTHDRDVYDAAPPPTLVDEALRHVSSEEVARTQAERVRLLELRDELRSQMPGRRVTTSRFVAGTIVGILAAADWTLFALGGQHLFGDGSAFGLSFVGGIVLALGAVLTGISTGLYFSMRASMREEDIENEKLLPEIRDVERRIEALGRRP